LIFKKMEADSFYYIGTGHKYCQDHALSYGFNQYAYAILSDGCSGSKNSDFGARILTNIAKNNLNLIDEPYFGELIISQASLVCQQLDLNPETLDATLLLALVKNNYYKIRVFGDGAVCLKYKDGKIKLFDINFPSNAPYYLNYEINSNRKKIFYEMFYKDERILTILDERLDSKKEIKNESHYFFESGSIEDLESITLFSDGVSSFYDYNNHSIDTTTIVKELTNFKGKGEFVQR